MPSVAVDGNSLPLVQGFYVRGRPISRDNFPSVGVLPDGVNFVLQDDLVYIDRFGILHVAWTGLETDGGTIPQPLQSVIGGPWSGKRRYAYIIHDQKCVEIAKLPREQRDAARKAADDLLLEMCKFLGENGVGRLVYFGVRTGWNCWLRWLPNPKPPKDPGPLMLYGRVAGPKRFVDTEYVV